MKETLKNKIKEFASNKIKQTVIIKSIKIEMKIKRFKETFSGI